MGKDIQLILKYNIAARRLAKIDFDENDDCMVLFEESKKNFGVPIECQMLKFKRDGYTIRIVPGWPIKFYEMKSQSVIVLESTEDNIDLLIEEETGNTHQNKERLLKKERNQKELKRKTTLMTIAEEDEGGHGNATRNKLNFIKSTKEEMMKRIIAAVKKGEGEFSALIKEGDNFFDICNDDGWYIIHYAINFHNKLAVKHMIESCVNMDVETKEGITPLMLCVSKKEAELLKILVESGLCNINKLAKKGTVLHYAIELNNKQFINYLLSKGANPFIEDNNGQKAIDMLQDEELKQRILKSKEDETTLKSLKQKPDTVRGSVYKTGHFFRNLKKRYLVMDTNQRTLVRYKCKEDVPHKPVEVIPLNAIKSVTEVKSKMFLQSGFHYFEISCGAKLMFATGHPELTQLWVSCLRRGIDYSVKLEASLRKNDGLKDKVESNEEPAAEVDLDGEARQRGSLQAKVMVEKRVLPPKPKINLGSFEILKFLGRGSFGRVYKVRLKSNGKIYAMKVLNKELLYVKKQIKYAQSEANILKNANHPFILSLHFAFQTPNNLYMVIDYCSGGDLSILIAQHTNFEEAQVKFYTAELILAMENLHSMGVLYRDLKPENILLDLEGHIKLADFGLSKENIGKNDVAKSFCGSHIYLSPEMVSMKGFTQASDNYGIGLCIYEMMFGQLPFYNEDIDKLHALIKKEELRFPSDIEASAQMVDLISRLLTKNPKERLGSRSKDEIKSHPFFAGINWEDVLRKKLKPPFVEEEEEDVDVRRRLKLNDKDYTEQNKGMFRVPDFTFVRDTEISSNGAVANH